jgi:hypothetical protein
MGILRPRPQPKRVYPNSDRFEEDGRMRLAASILLAIAATTVAISVLRMLLL